MPLAKLVPLSEFECNQSTVTIVQTPTDVLVAQLDPSVADANDSFQYFGRLLDELNDFTAYFVNIGRYNETSPMDRLAFTELLIKEDGALHNPSPRIVHWLQVTHEEELKPIEIGDCHDWMTKPENYHSLLSIYHRLASTSKVKLN